MRNVFIRLSELNVYMLYFTFTSQFLYPEKLFTYALSELEFARDKSENAPNASIADRPAQTMTFVRVLYSIGLYPVSHPYAKCLKTMQSDE